MFHLKKNSKEFDFNVNKNSHKFIFKYARNLRSLKHGRIFYVRTYNLHNSEMSKVINVIHARSKSAELNTHRFY